LLPCARRAHDLCRFLYCYVFIATFLMTQLSAIDKRNFDQLAADWIRDAVMSGTLVPGERVTEMALAGKIGLSRSTVRAAMQRLAGEGLLVRHAYSAWEVASLTAEDAWELYSVRSPLEGLAARLASERIDEVGRSTLYAALGALVQAIRDRDWPRIADADIGFHRTVVSLAGHKRLGMLHDQIITPIHLYMLSSNRSGFDDLISFHTQFVETIVQGNADAAQQMAADHVMNSCGLVLDWFNSRQQDA